MKTFAKLSIDYKQVLLPLIVMLAIFVLSAGVCAQTAQADVNTTTYTYDDAGRLIRVSYSDNVAITYNYDNAGNLIERIVGTAEWTAWEYDSDNDDSISKQEALSAVVDFFSGEITRQQALAVIVLFFS